MRYTRLKQPGSPRHDMLGFRKKLADICCGRQAVLAVAIGTVIVIIFIFYRLEEPGMKFDPWEQALYSPALVALAPKPRVFEGGFGLNSTIYSGAPTDENNKHWEDLYNFGISRLSVSEARPLVNKTLPIPGDSDHYIISLSVFHQLHCLNRLRLAVYGEIDWTHVDDSKGITHIDHCINAIRQSLMCSADVTPLTFVRDTDGKAKEVMEVIHSCRNFEAVQAWGVERALHDGFDVDTLVEDDPLGWGSYGLEEQSTGASA